MGDSTYKYFCGNQSVSVVTCQPLHVVGQVKKPDDSVGLKLVDTYLTSNATEECVLTIKVAAGVANLKPTRTILEILRGPTHIEKMHEKLL